MIPAIVLLVACAVTGRLLGKLLDAASDRYHQRQRDKALTGART